MSDKRPRGGVDEPWVRSVKRHSDFIEKPSIAMDTAELESLRSREPTDHIMGQPLNVIEDLSAPMDTGEFGDSQTREPVVIGDRDMTDAPELAARRLDLQLIDASLLGDTGAVVTLLRKGAQPNVVDRAKHSPLHYAGLRGHTEIVERLLRPVRNRMS